MAGGTIDSDVPEGDGGRLDNETAPSLPLDFCPCPSGGWKLAPTFVEGDITPPTVSGSGGSPGLRPANAVRNVYCLDGTLYAQVGYLSIRARGLEWSDLQTYELDCAGGGSDCEECPEDLCAELDGSGAVTAILTADVSGRRSVLPGNCPPENNPGDPDATCPFPSAPGTPGICLELTGAWYSYGGGGGSFDSSAHPSDSRGGYPIELSPANGGRGCVWGDWDGLQGVGSPPEDNNYLSTHGVAAYYKFAPFGYDPGASGVGDGPGTGGFNWKVANLQIVWIPEDRTWQILELPGIGTNILFEYVVPDGVPYPYLPITIPATTTTLPSGDQYHVDKAVIKLGSCFGLSANPGQGLFPGSEPPETFQLATTYPTADTADMVFNPASGVWAGLTVGGLLPVTFSAVDSPVLTINGVIQNLKSRGVMNGNYEFDTSTVSVPPP